MSIFEIHSNLLSRFILNTLRTGKGVSIISIDNEEGGLSSWPPFSFFFSPPSSSGLNYEIFQNRSDTLLFHQ